LLQVAAAHPFVGTRLGVDGEPELYVNKRAV
jgi:hypothetical protein